MNRYKSYPTYPMRYGNGINNRRQPGGGAAAASDSDDESSTHSVRVSRLIEKIKLSQQGHGGNYRNTISSYPDAFSYDDLGRTDIDELIYSRVESSNRFGGGKRTVRERVVPNYYNQFHGRGGSSSSGRHKTTVLLNSDNNSTDANEYEINRSEDDDTSFMRNKKSNLGMRYFGEETDYEYDRVLSRKFREEQEENTLQKRNNKIGGNATATATSSPQHHQRGGSIGAGPIPKIILHEEAVAEIPNGRGCGVIGGGTRSPSVNRNNGTDEEFNTSGGTAGKSSGSRFLGGLLTLKRGKSNKNKLRGGSNNVDGEGSEAALIGGGRSGTHSPTSSPSRRTGTSYLNVPGSGGTLLRQKQQQQQTRDFTHESSSSPKYYVPYHRSTPTLYNDATSNIPTKYERDRMMMGSSAGGSVLSNGSYVNRHVSRSMSMKAPWEPRLRTNEINYYNEGAYTKRAEVIEPPQRKQKSSSPLKRSKSMPGKKLTSLIGNWVSGGGGNKGGTLKRGGEGAAKEEHRRTMMTSSKSATAGGVPDDEEKLIGGGKDQSKSNNWGRFTLLRFGKNKKESKKHPPPPIPVVVHREPSPQRPARGVARSSVSPLRSNRYDTIERGSRRGDHQHRSSGGGTLLRGSSNQYGGGGGGDTLKRGNVRGDSSYY